MPAFMASGSSGQVLMTVAKAGSTMVNAPDSAPPSEANTVFPGIIAGVRIPPLLSQRVSNKIQN
jgi:hypothetical protein